MTFEQHEKFVKNGIRLYEEQMAECEKIKKEKERLEEKKKEKMKEKEKINLINNHKKFGAKKIKENAERSLKVGQENGKGKERKKREKFQVIILKK